MATSSGLRASPAPSRRKSEVQADRAGQPRTPATTVIADQIDTVDVDAGTTNASIPPFISIIVISAFAIVLVGSFITLAVSMFVAPSDPANIQIILTMFTTVVGFLGGLFTPVPRSSRKV